jgi:cellulose synthase/poly-beta-1,6-N-acetylglucosamine synthase-like glycosyltransferase
MSAIRASLKAISQKKRHLEKEAHESTVGLVSVCIPNFNKGKYIYQCIESIKNQSYKEIEIIVVDDCSTDNSRTEINRAMKRLDPYFFLEELERPGHKILHISYPRVNSLPIWTVMMSQTTLELQIKYEQLKKVTGMCAEQILLYLQIIL